VEVPRRVVRRSLPRPNRLVFALFLLFAAAASTKPAATPLSAPPKALGACSAVTAEDLERALGRRFGRGREENRGAESTCDYGAGNGLVSITIQRLNAKVDIPREIESLKRSIVDSSVRMVSDLGSAAFYLDISGAGTQLHVVRDDHDYVMVSILGFGDATQVSAAAERMARAALGRI
jgi:hypothetical protein